MLVISVDTHLFHKSFLHGTSYVSTKCRKYYYCAVTCQYSFGIHSL